MSILDSILSLSLECPFLIFPSILFIVYLVHKTRFLINFIRYPQSRNLGKTNYLDKYYNSYDNIGDVMVGVLVSSAVDRGFKSLSG